MTSRPRGGQIDPAAAGAVFSRRPEPVHAEIIARALGVAGIRRPIVPAPALLLELAAQPLRLLPSPPLTPDAVDFINAPATVDLEPLLARMPRRLTPLDEGLATYLAPGTGPAAISIDEPSVDGPVATQVAGRAAP
jgi:hypothetical protein